jgi:hypothetical protein
MPERPRARTTVVFLIFLAGLFFLALFMVPRLPAPQAANAPAPTLAAPTLPPADPSCQDAAEGLIAKLDPLVAQWEIERQQADRAPLDQLAAQVDKLRGVRQQAGALKPPACAEAAYRSLLDAMDRYIKGYQGFVAELPEDAIRGELDAARSEFSAYTEGIDRLRKP